MDFMSFDKNLNDSSNINTVPKNIIKLITGSDSRSAREKFCQYANTISKSEKIKEKNCINPALASSRLTIWKVGKIAIKEPANPIEKIMILLLKAKTRCSLLIRAITFPNNSGDGSTGLLFIDIVNT